jgi:hypothetical protein
VAAVFYKNMAKQYVERCLNQGEVLLRPIRFFRSTGDEREDKLEGTRGVQIRSKEIIKVPADELWTPGNIFIRSGYGEIHPGAEVDIDEELPEAYSFSVSEGRQPHLGDAAYRILNSDGLGRGLLRALRAAGQPISQDTFAPVRYGEYKDAVTTAGDLTAAKDKLISQAGLDPYFVKPSSYAGELEWRFIYVLEEGTKAKDFMLVKDPALVKFCASA